MPLRGDGLNATIVAAQGNPATTPDGDGYGLGSVEATVDEALFSSEWDRGSEALRRYASTWMRDADEREDLVQLAWVIAWEKRDSYRGDGDFVHWLLCLGRTVCGREHERRRCECLVPLPEDLLDASDCDAVSEDKARARQERDERLLIIIVSLAPRQRAAIIAHHGFGYSVKQIAEMTGKSPATVKATLAQARRKLRQLEEDLSETGGATNPFGDDEAH